MLTQPQIDKLKAYPQMGLDHALTSVGHSRFAGRGNLCKLSLLDEQNLVEIQSPEYPGSG